MLETNFKIATRSMVRQKLFSAINISGLAVGITACFLILMYVRRELSYDRYHPNADRTYRVWVSGALGGNDFSMAVTAAPMAAALKADYPDIETVTRGTGIGGFPVIRYGDKVFSEERWTAMDSTAFEVFGLELLRGDPGQVLNQPMQVLITESTARRYFGDEDPLGKTLNSDRRRDFVVSGVIKDMPQNSHAHYDFIASMSSYQQSESQQWMNHNYYTYLVLNEGYDPEELEAKLPGMVTKYVGPQIEQALGVSYDELLENGAAYAYHLQPITAIHLNSDLDEEIEVNGSTKYIYIFSIVALFILGLAAINYMNLSTARSAERAKEVGIRKTLGSNRKQLIMQFLTESVVFTVLAGAIAFVLIKLSLPWFNNLVGLQLQAGLSLLWPLLGVSVIVGLVAGVYPAFFLSSFHAATILQGGQSPAGKGSRLRNGLVIFQFAVSVFLFSGALLIKNQLDHMQNKPLGFNKENLLVIEKTDDIGMQVRALKQTLLDHPAIESVTNSRAIPGRNGEFGSSVFGIETETGVEMQLLITMFADFQFAETYGLTMAQGRFFDPQFATDSQAVVINAAAARAFGMDDLAGKDLKVFGGPNGERSLKIIGILDDFHFESVHQTIRPMIIFPFGNNVFGGAVQFGKFLTVRINPANVGEILATAESAWKEIANDQAFEYVFLDDDLRRLYAFEARTQAIISVFTVLAISIAGLGLLGLAAFSMEQRSKEIGIRKVLGASLAQIFVVLSRDMMSLVLIAIGVALPVSYFLMNRWLEDFAYRVGYNPANFLIAGVGALVIALITISYQVLRAAVANPINALRYE